MGEGTRNPEPGLCILGSVGTLDQGRWDTGWRLEWREGLDKKEPGAGPVEEQGGLSVGGPLMENELPVKKGRSSQVWVLAVWHLRQSTWPSRGKQPLSSASMDRAFPQS